MGIYSHNLPQLKEQIFITDAGLETELCFHKNIKLPEFAAYDLLRTQEGYEMLFDYYATYAELARKYARGLVLETTTWRANRDWGKKIGDSPERLDQLNRKAVELLLHIRSEYASDTTAIVISGNLGPRGDGYVASQRMNAEQAKDYHLPQIQTLVDAGVDLITSLTLNYVEEAIGIVKAAQQVDIPVVISFTVETDGRLPTGETLQQAIETVDRETNNGPVYYMINCAHPTHFGHLFNEQQVWIKRVRGIRGNASSCSHEELDNAEVLDEGNPDEFGAQCHHLHKMSPNLNILGGCCGTDHRHIEAICRHF